MLGLFSANYHTLNPFKRDEARHQHLGATLSFTIFKIVPVFGSDTVPIQFMQIIDVVEILCTFADDVTVGENSSCLNQQIPIKAKDDDFVLYSPRG